MKQLFVTLALIMLNIPDTKACTIQYIEQGNRTIQCYICPGDIIRCD